MECAWENSQAYASFVKCAKIHDTRRVTSPADRLEYHIAEPLLPWEDGVKVNSKGLSVNTQLERRNKRMEESSEL